MYIKVQPEKYLIEKVGTIPIKEIYEKNYNSSELREKAREVFSRFRRNVIPNSWSGTRDTFDGTTIPWHQDGGCKYFYLAAYPFTTQILQIHQPLQIPYGDELSQICIEQAIEQGKASILEPKVGEVYHLSVDVIHRTNPKSGNVRHLVMRATYGE